MQYVTIGKVNPNDIVIRAKRFWTTSGKRVVLSPKHPPTLFGSAVQQAKTKYDRMGSVTLPPDEVPARSATPRRWYQPQIDRPVDRPLLLALEEWRAEFGWSVTRAGRELANDPSLIPAVRNGRQISSITLLKIKARVEELRQCIKHPTGRTTRTRS